MMKLHISEHDVVDSTNAEAKRCFSEYKDEGVWVIEARRQTAGYGRKGSVWQSESDKNYYGTFCVRQKSTLTPGLWSLWVARCLVVALKEHVSKDKHLFVKWPNDLCILEKGEVTKVGGILSGQRMS